MSSNFIVDRLNMKFRQLHYVYEVAQRGLNMTAAANALFTSQPGVSKQIRLLEEELGVDIFIRVGKQVTEITPAGAKILEYTAKLFDEVQNIKSVAQEFKGAEQGALSIATTHAQARYALPPVIARFREGYPKVVLHLYEGAPPHIAKLAAEGQADFAIATEAMEHFEQLVMLPCFHWNRSVLVQPGHPLTQVERLSLEDIAAYPIVTYTFGFTGRSKLDQAFAARGLHPNVVLTAIDADVIKTYVRLGMGIGIVSSLAYDAKQDADLVRLSVDHLFEPSTTHIGFRRGMFLRGYMYEFIEQFAPHLTPTLINEVASIYDPHERALRTQELISNLQII
jgi:LysR family cys regulon transcriptional activator